MERYDVAIIGAGVSGGVAAYILSKHMNVIVFEKYKLPRYKLCGGGITNKTISFLKSIGLDINKSLIESYINEIEIKIKNEKKVLKFKEPLGILTRRDLFDEYLIRKSEAEILDETKVLDVNICGNEVIIKTNRGEYKSRYLLGCDGATSLVKRKFFEMEKEIGVAAQIEIPITYKRIFIDFDVVKNGYAWIFPKRNFSSIGVGYIREYEKLPIKKVLENFLSSLGLSYEGLKIKVHPLPYFIGRKNVVYRRNICICGDAANLIDPVTGEGTFNAAYSAYLASKAILEGDLTLYEKYYLDTIYKEMKRASLIAKIFYQKKEFSKYLLLNTNFFEEMLNCICNDGRCYTRNYYINILKLIPLYIMSKIRI